MGICLLLVGCGQPPPNLEESIRVANENLSSGNTEQAILLLEDLLKSNPGHSAILENLAFAYAQSGSHEMAAFYFQETANSGPNRNHFLLYAAEALRQSGKLPQAVESYEKYLAEHANSPVEWKKLGQLQETLNNSGKAVESYLQSQRLKPTGENAIRIGQLFRGMNNQAQANHWFQVAFEASDGAQGEALLGLLAGAILNENFERAEDLIQQLDSGFPGLLDNSPLAQRRQELEQWRSRQDELQRQLQEQERIARELQEKAAHREAEATALTAAREKEEEEAKKKMEAVRLEAPPPPSASGFLQKARSSLAAGNPEEAIKNYWASLKLDDNPAEVWHELSDLLLKEGKNGLAEATALETIRREPKSTLYTMHYLKVAQITKEPDQFMEELIYANHKIPDSPDITLALARGYKIIKNSYREAAFLYRNFLEQAPNHPESSQAQEELASLPTN